MGNPRMKVFLVALTVATVAFALPQSKKDYATMFNAIHPGFWSVVEPNGGITVSRTINSASGITGTAVVDSGCSSKDQYGSNDCTFSWGQKLGLTLNTTLAADVNSGTIAIDAKVDGFIPFSASCKVCGEPCTITIPVVKKTITIKLPDCPLKGGNHATTLSVTIPTTDPVPIKVTAKGTVTITTDSVKLSADFDASLEK